MFQVRLQKTLSIVTLAFFMLFFSSIAFAETNNNPFLDITENFWGVKDIVKLNLRKVVNGYSDGKFYPNQPVTQIEAVLMAVRNMGGLDPAFNPELDQPLPVTVPSWSELAYKKEILYALEKGLIVPTENNFNASTYASRAWVAQLLVRMLNKSDEAAQLANYKSSFADAGAIPVWAVPSVNLAIKYKLLTGYPDNNFKANQSITRAETITLLSRSEQYLDLKDKLILGKIVSRIGLNLNISVSGTIKNYQISEDSWIFDAAGKPTTLDNLRDNDYIKIIYNDSKVQYVEKIPADAVSTTISGSVLQVMAKEKIIVIKDALQRVHTLTVSPLAMITNLEQFIVGAKVELRLNGQGEIISIMDSNNLQEASNTAIIYTLNPEQKVLTLKNTAGKITAYQYSEQTIIKIAGQRFPTIKDLQVGDQIKYQATAGIVTEIELIKATQQLTLTGKVVVIAPEKRILTIQKDDNSLAAFSLADSAQIKIAGLSYPQLVNVLVNDRVELNIEQGKIIALSVLDRTVENAIQGQIVAIDTTSKIIVIKTEKEELKSYELSAQVEYLIDGRTSSTLHDVKKDMQVEIRLVDNKINFIKTVNSAEGSVVALDKTLRKITLRINSLATRTYSFANIVDLDIEGDSNPELNEVLLNDYVEVSLDDNLVTKIKVRKIFSYQIMEITKNINQIKVKEKDQNVIRYIYLSNQVTLLISGKASPTIDNLIIGNNLKATFLGNKLTTVEVLP